MCTGKTIAYWHKPEEDQTSALTTLRHFSTNVNKFPVCKIHAKSVMLWQILKGACPGF